MAIVFRFEVSWVQRKVFEPRNRRCDQAPSRMSRWGQIPWALCWTATSTKSLRHLEAEQQADGPIPGERRGVSRLF